ncbi:MAG: hypothetical protein KGL39_50295 [Patescibacteria group bacterium]|nr:hypothetical protein [Patescibacteria group bacterium]
MFNLSPVDAIKAKALEEFDKAMDKVKKLDLDHDGVADLDEAKKLIEEGAAELKAVEAEITPSEMAFALNVLFPGKWSPERIVTIEASVSKLIDGAEHIAGVAQAAPHALHQ